MLADRVDFNPTTHGHQDLVDDCLSNIIEGISIKRLRLEDVEAEIIDRSFVYLIYKFAEEGNNTDIGYTLHKDIGYTSEGY
jgi:type I restriction enzyme M protein